MKCQYCGKNEANYHYRSNVNGKIAEQHLCHECAAAMEGSVFSRAQRETNYDDPLQSLMSPTGFNCDSLWDNMAKGFFRDFGGYPQVVMINPSINRQGAPRPPADVQASPGEKLIPADAGEDVKRRRELNRLRSEMGTAVKSEEFEQAARLRDEIYKLEQEK